MPAMAFEVISLFQRQIFSGKELAVEEVDAFKRNCVRHTTTSWRCLGIGQSELLRASAERAMREYKHGRQAREPPDLEYPAKTHARL